MGIHWLDGAITLGMFILSTLMFVFIVFMADIAERGKYRDRDH